MPLLLVIVVVGLIYIYLRLQRHARLAWLQKLSLPGVWVADASSPVWTLTLQGGLDRGPFQLGGGGAGREGHWRLHGHTLVLSTVTRVQRFDLRLFSTGTIGLIDTDGDRHVLRKQAPPETPANVVPLRR